MVTLGEGRCRDREETHTEVLVLGKKRSSLRLNGGSVRPGRGLRLDFLTL